MNISCCTNNPSSQDESSAIPESLKTTYQTNAQLSTRDILGNWSVRWGIGRMRYTVKPGLYKIGNPDNSSPVLVTSNYKLTFDSLRKELNGVNGWILVLDTEGVNVWCAAGKGTFGTEELIAKIKSVNLADIVLHRTVILPQLGAPGVAAHQITKATGFKVVYGPVYAKNVKRFLSNGLIATKSMRKVNFGLIERLKVIPMEIVLASFLVPVFLIILAVFNIVEGTLSFKKLLLDFIPYFGAYITGTIIFQLVFPFIPGRSFALKGGILGLLWAILVNYLFAYPLMIVISHLLIIPMIVSYLSLNFTGATTFTSLSGVLKEVRITTPIVITGVSTGIVIRIVSMFLR